MQTELIPITTQEVTTSNQSRMDELLNGFIPDPGCEGKLEATIQARHQQYFKWINSRSLEMTNVIRADILVYKKHLMVSGLTSLSVGSYITSGRRFYEWAEANKYYPNVAKGVKSPKRKQQFEK